MGAAASSSVAALGALAGGSGSVFAALAGGSGSASAALSKMWSLSLHGCEHVYLIWWIHITWLSCLLRVY
ncbi:unnamed protein product [Urochloa humidicola]